MSGPPVGLRLEVAGASEGVQPAPIRVHDEDVREAAANGIGACFEDDELPVGRYEPEGAKILAGVYGTGSCCRRATHPRVALKRDVSCHWRPRRPTVVAGTLGMPALAGDAGVNRWRWAPSALTVQTECAPAAGESSEDDPRSVWRPIRVDVLGAAQRMVSLKTFDLCAFMTNTSPSARELSLDAADRFASGLPSLCLGVGLNGVDGNEQMLSVAR